MNLWLLGLGGKWRKGTVREFGTDTYALPNLKWITKKNLLYSTWNSAQCYVATLMGWEFGGQYINVYVWFSPFTVHLKRSLHCYRLYPNTGASLVVRLAKNLPANAEDTRDRGLIPALERFPGEGNSNPLRYSCLGRSMDRGAW